MPKFIYIAKSSPREIMEGRIEAESEQAAIIKLTQMGFYPVSVHSEILSFSKKEIFYTQKISQSDIVLFTQQLASLVESSIDIIKAMTIIAHQMRNRYFKSVLTDVITKVENGKPLSESLASFPHLFPAMYSSMVHIGEVGGSLATTLKCLSDFMEKEDEFKKSLQASLTYPFFVLGVGIATVFALFVFVIPRLTSMFSEMGQVLPLPTQILINTSNVLYKFWWLIVLVIFLAVFFLCHFYHHPRGRMILDRLKLKTAVIGPIILKTEISRLTRTLSFLLLSGMPISGALEISSSVLDNEVLKTEIRQFRKQVNEGGSLSASFSASRFFPEFVTSIVSTGEQTGFLEKSLSRIAQDYEKDVDRRLKSLIRLSEPLIILIVGLIVGFIVLSMLLPIFQINLMVY